MMKKLLGLCFLYILLAVLLLPLGVTLLFGGLGKGISYVGISAVI